MDLVEDQVRDAESTVRHPWERARLTLAHELISRRVALRPGDVVLDVGCGDTLVSEELARRYPAVQFYAVDSAFTHDLISKLRARLTVSNLSLFRSPARVPSHNQAALVQ